MKTYSELLAQWDDLKNEIDRAREREAQRLAQRVLELLAESGVDVRDMMYPRPRGQGGGRRITAKYWNAQAGAAWSGRGRMPKWLIGQNPRQFLILHPDDERDGCAQAHPGGSN